jgi:hypothetical protein
MAPKDNKAGVATRLSVVNEIARVLAGGFECDSMRRSTLASKVRKEQ